MAETARPWGSLPSVVAAEPANTRVGRAVVEDPAAEQAETAAHEAAARQAKVLTVATPRRVALREAVAQERLVSTRPGAKGISREEEIQQISTALKILKPVFPELFFSVDTWRSGVAEVAVNEGAVMINDISGGTMDSEMFTTISKLKVPYILMHIQGTPETMQSKPHYHDVVLDIKQFFAERLQILRDLGVKDVILDPGFGFGKTVEHNFQLLNSLDAFRVFGLPVLAGLSRKSFIQKTLGVSAEDALNRTTVLNTLAVLKGANILRVHDPREAREIVLLTRKMLIKAD